MTGDIILANKKLNEWCNTEGINYYEGITALGNLLKYAVPELELLQIILQPDNDEWYCGVTTDKDQQTELYEAGDKDPALALFRAIYKALGGERC